MELVSLALASRGLYGHQDKVKYIAPYVSMVEAVDSIKLLREINKQAEKCGRVINVLLELHIADLASARRGASICGCC